MASPGNQHCVNCIGTLSFPIVNVDHILIDCHRLIWWWTTGLGLVFVCWYSAQRPDLQTSQCHDYLTTMSMPRSTYDWRLIYKTAYEGRKAIFGY